MEHYNPEYKLILVGDGGTGKTTYIKRHLTGEFEKKYKPTNGVEIHPIKFYTNHGPLLFNIWDIAGIDELAALKDGYFVSAHCAIIMFDVTSRSSYKNVPKWHRDILRVCDSIPTVLAGNKVDMKDRKVQARQILYHKRHDLQYFDVSTKICYQFDKPFIWLARKVSNWPDLVFVEAPAMPPPEVVYSCEVLARIKGEFGELDKISEESANVN